MFLTQSVPHILWNLFLAFIPAGLAVLVALGIRQQQRGGERLTWILWGPLLLVWLTFLPNTVYLLTEWRHFLETVADTQFYHLARQDHATMVNFLLTTAFYIAYTNAGLLAFFFAIWPLERRVTVALARRLWPVKLVFFPVVSLGVYLGLVERFNTWDLLTAHGLKQVLESIGDVFQRPLLMALIVGFGLILWGLYTVFNIWVDGVLWRIRARRSLRRAASEQRREEHHASP